MLGANICYRAPRLTADSRFTLECVRIFLKDEALAEAAVP
ncbi:MAG: hypothetical protein ICCCNLDF_00643 [Planctomycetes bacterium]|nr:hypothetical protein [Planctomycetota bacterium]